MSFHALDSFEFFAEFVAFKENSPIIGVVIILVEDNANSAVFGSHVNLVEFTRC